MKLLSFLSMLSVLFLLSGCPKKAAEPTDTTNEPVEGSSTASSDKATESGGGDEMQEKKGGAETPAEGDAAAPAADHK